MSEENTVHPLTLEEYNDLPKGTRLWYVEQESETIYRARSAVKTQEKGMSTRINFILTMEVHSVFSASLEEVGEWYKKNKKASLRCWELIEEEKTIHPLTFEEFDVIPEGTKLCLLRVEAGKIEIYYVAKLQEIGQANPDNIVYGGLNGRSSVTGIMGLPREGECGPHWFTFEECRKELVTAFFNCEYPDVLRWLLDHQDQVQKRIS